MYGLKHQTITVEATVYEPRAILVFSGLVLVRLGFMRLGITHEARVKEFKVHDARVHELRLRLNLDGELRCVRGVQQTETKRGLSRT